MSLIWRGGLKFAPMIWTAAAVWAAACGGGGKSSSSGPVTAPSPVGQALAPTVNVSDLGPPGGSNNLWSNGNLSFDAQTGSNTLGLQLTQTGAQVTGQFFIYGPDGGSGPLAGTVSGNTLSFNFSVGNSGQGCGNTASATATVGTSSMTGTFSGNRCNGQPYSNGRFTVSLPSGYRTLPFPIGGTWAASPAPGGGTWTFQLSEQVKDVSSSVLTGSVTVSGNDGLHLGSGSVVGSVANTFPGPTTIVTLNVSFAGVCPSTVQMTQMLINGGSQLNPGFSGGGVTGKMCTGQTPFAFNLLRK